MKTEAGRKLILIDGNGLAYRSFYAVPPQKTASGLPTNALLGFTNLLLNVLLAEKPSHVAVAFDQSAPTERLQKFQGYNAQREELPDELAVQIPMIEDLVRECGLAVCRVRGHEADDCIGTLASRARNDGFSVLIVSGDLDLLQLVAPRVKVQTTRRGIGDLVVYDEALVRKRYNLDPCQLADLRALAGDSSQNIGGVPGIGEVTARKLLSQYRSLDDLLNSLDQLPAKWRNPLSENRDDACEFKTRATIVTDLAVDCDWERCAFHGVRTARLAEILERVEANGEFEHLLRRLEATSVPSPERLPLRTAAGDEARDLLAAAASGHGPLGLAWLVVDRQELGLGVATAEGSAYVPLGADGLAPDAAWALLRPALEDAARTKYVYRMRDVASLPGRSLLAEAPALVDLAVASCLLDVGESDHRLEAIARRHDRTTPTEDELWGLEGRAAGKVDLGARSRWTAGRAASLLELGPVLEGRLAEAGVADLFQRVDMPLARALVGIEAKGLALDEAAVHEVERLLEAELEALRHEIHAEADRPFNLDCDKELGEFLFDSLGLLVPSRPKNGGSIGAEVLVSLVGQHPIALTVRNYRELSEFKAAFVEGFLRHRRAEASVGGSLFNPALTAEARLSWLGPVAGSGTVAAFHQMMAVIDNLQSLPVRQKVRDLVERSLVAHGTGQRLVSLELDQLELRLLARLSGDADLAAALAADLETALAAEFFEVAPEEVRPDMRRTAVQVALHGMGPRWLARRLDLTEEGAAERARSFHRSFAGRFPRAAAWSDEQLERSRAAGRTETLAGRRRPVPEIHSRNFDIREAALRLARHAPVEGSAGDVLRAALAGLHEAIVEGRLPARLVMQVHNRVVLQAPEAQTEEVAREAVALATAAAPAGLDLPVRVTCGDTWHDLRPLERETVGT